MTEHLEEGGITVGVDVRDLVAQIREDARAHGQRTRPGFHAIAVHRLGVWGEQQSRPVRTLTRLVHKVVNTLVIRNLYGIEMYRSTVIGRRVILPHHYGVVLGRWAVIGDDCIIRQHVTLGKATDLGPDREQPRLEDRVEVGAGATIMGGITVGAGAKIGPNAVVLRDVPAGATAFAPLTKIMRPAEST